MSNTIRVKMEHVSGEFDLETDKIVCVQKRKYQTVDLCLCGNMNIPFARIELFDSCRLCDQAATFDDATKLGETIAARFNAAQDAVKALEWMIRHFDWANEQMGFQQPDSPELAEAKETLRKLKGQA